MTNNKQLVIVRVRGLTGIKHEIKDTLKMLNLHKRNFCVVIPDTPSNKGMIKKSENYTAWGEIDEKTLKLLEKRKLEGKKFYRLNSPKKGYGRKGLKCAFAIGGALGYRGEKINDLIQRML